MTQAHWLTSFRRFASAAAVAAAAAGSAGAQSLGQVTVAVRGGYVSFDKAASLDASPVMGLDAMYGINNWLSIGPSLGLGRPQTTGSHFVSVITYGVLNLGDTTYFYEATQPVNVLDGALNVRVQLPGRKLSPYATAGIGGYTLFLDVQANRGERHKVGLSFNVGAGLLYALSERAGLTLDVRSLSYTDYDRGILDPRNDVVNFRSRVEETLYAEDFKPAPRTKSTVTNFVFSFGFSYVPFFFGGGGA